MTLRQYLSLWTDNVSMKLYTHETKGLKHIETDTVDNLIDSDKEFLNYEIDNLQMDDDLLVVILNKN